MLLCEFRVDGLPLPQPRADLKAVNIWGKWVARAYRKKDDPITGYRDGINLAARMAKPKDWPLDAAYRLLALIVLPRTAEMGLGTKDGGESRIQTTLPDADNYLKAIQDALKGILWSDDGRVYSPLPVKIYARPREKPHVRVLVVAEDRKRTVDPDRIVAAWHQMFTGESHA